MVCVQRSTGKRLFLRAEFILHAHGVDSLGSEPISRATAAQSLRTLECKGIFGRLPRIIGHPVNEKVVPPGFFIQPTSSTRYYSKDDTYDEAMTKRVRRAPQRCRPYRPMVLRPTTQDLSNRILEGIAVSSQPMSML